jgi:hypothetical protein
MKTSIPTLQPSFQTEQADFFFPFRSCERVGLRREKSLFTFAIVGAAFRADLMDIPL